MTEATIALVEPRLALSLFGARDQHLRNIREKLGVTITHRDGAIHVSGEESAVSRATEVLEQLKALAERRGEVSPEDVTMAISQFEFQSADPSAMSIEINHTMKRVKPRTPGQAQRCAGDSAKRSNVRHWSGGDRQNLLGGGLGGGSVQEPGSPQDCACAAGGRSGRKPGILAR